MPQVQVLLPRPVLDIHNIFVVDIFLFYIKVERGNTMKFYLVDYENVCINGLNGLSKLDENTTVCIFYSENNDKLSFGLHKRLCEAKANIKYFKANISSKNALDFQLTFYAGYLCSKYPDCEIIIISNDKEYDCLNKISNTQN